MTKKVLLSLSLSLFLLSHPFWGKEVVYDIFYGFFPAGVLKIKFEPDRVVIKGKSSGLVSLFYRYKLYMVYYLDNATGSFLTEDENGKHRRYDYQTILRKKSWLPLVVKILTTHGGFSRGKPLSVGNIKVFLTEVKGDDYFFKVVGSKKVEEVKLYGWRKNSFPQRIVIEGKSGSLILVRED